MNKLMLYLFLITGSALLFFSCSDKNSNEACIHQVTMDLDRGNYDAVLASGCAGAMQKGAAYFGKAGFDVNDVINNFSKTGSSTSGTSDLSTYMTSLIPEVDDGTFTYLGLAKGNYCSAAGSTLTVTTDICSPLANPASQYYKDAFFYISLVDTVKSLSLIRTIIPNLLNPDGTLNTTCDRNGNGVPDEVDATSCALRASGTATPASGNCIANSTIYAAYAAASADISFTGKSGAYRGLDITPSGTSTPACLVAYKRLLYKDTSNTYWVATTSGSCIASDGQTWPCPIETNGQPMDLVTAIDNSLTSASSSLSSALTGTTDVGTSITDIQTQACGTDASCTSAEIAAYLQTIK